MLFESPDVLDGLDIFFLYLFLYVIGKVAEEVDACILLQGLDVDHIVAQLVA